jgi:hypothetical protein
MSGPMRLSQVSVPLPAELREWLEAQAAQDRSVGGQARRVINSAT